MATADSEQLGTLLKRFRLVAAFSQDELAERSTVSVRTISDLERGIRDTARLETIRLLASALNLSESERGRLIEASVRHLPFELTDAGQAKTFFMPRPATSTRVFGREHYDRPQVPERRNTIPKSDVPSGMAGIPLPSTSFVGREREVEELHGLLQQENNRLITLTGPGGVGKTRLAMTVAARFNSYPDWNVNVTFLAPIENWQSVVSAICQTFGVFDSPDRNYLDGIAEAIGDRRHLLLLDNFERVIEAAASLTAIVAHCPTLSILVTSRVLLRVSGEREVPVHPLKIPESSASIEQIAESPAVRLLQDRIRTTVGDGCGFGRSSDLPALAEICRRLDGLPLAIELAGARAKLFSVGELASGLRNGAIALDRGPRDAPHRHRSVQAAVSWSYDLLTTEEKCMFRLLAVFAGGLTLESAESVYSAFLKSKNVEFLVPPYELVTSLIEQNLLARTTTEDGRSRFVMLETIREFALDRLVQSGEEPSARRVHAEHFANRGAQVDAERVGFFWLDAPNSLKQEQGNLRVAIEWALQENDCDLAARLIGGIFRLWLQSGQFSEARATLARTLQCPGTLDRQRRASLLLDSAFFAWNQGDFVSCQALATESLSLYEELEWPVGIASANYWLAAGVLSEDPERAVTLSSKAVEAYRQASEDVSIVWSLEMLGGALMYVGDLAQAKSVFTEARELRAAIGSDRGHLLGWVAVAEGDLERAHALLTESLSSCRESGNLYSQIPALRLLGRVAAKRDDFAVAAQCFSEAMTIGMQLGSDHECVFCIAEYAVVAQACGESDRAARWLGFEEMFREQLHLGLTPDEAEIRDHNRQLAIVTLGEPAFSAFWSEGRQLRPHAAFSEARDWRPTLSPR